MLDDDESWALYPQMEARIRKFSEENELECSADAVLYEMRQRWVMAPNLTGYFVGAENGLVYSHLASWVSPCYGKNRLFIYQAQNEKGKDAFPEFKALLQDWIVKLNAVIPIKVEKGEFGTWHEPEKWLRYFKMGGLKAARLRHVIEFDIL